jgi:nucleoside-diphosphate-sugar epimerase
MRALVLGASGFLGSAVTRQLRAAGWAVTTAGRSAARDDHLTVDPAEIDPLSFASVLSALSPDVVVNCAGATTGDAETLARANVLGVRLLTRAMLQMSRSARLVHLGSAAEYGRTVPGVAVTEDAAPRPVAPYGMSKLAGTCLVEAAIDAGLEAIVLRVFNPIGPQASEATLVGRLLVELRSLPPTGGEIRTGPLGAERDFLDARDVADAVLAAAGAPRLDHAVINVASGVAVRVREVVRELVEVSGCAATIVEDGQSSSRSGALNAQRGDITRAREELSWKPERTIRDALADAWNGAA